MISKTNINQIIQRNAVLYDLICISDYNYNQFKTKIFVHNGVFNSSIDLASLGLTAAATVFGGPAAQAMTATDTAIKGAKSAVAQQWLQSQTAIALVTSMDSSRAEVQTMLYTNMTNPYDKFSIRAGIELIQELDSKANLIDAMAHLQKTISNQAVTNATAANNAKAMTKQ